MDINGCKQYRLWLYQSKAHAVLVVDVMQGSPLSTRSAYQLILQLILLLQVYERSAKIFA